MMPPINTLRYWPSHRSAMIPPKMAATHTLPV